MRIHTTKNYLVLHLNKRLLLFIAVYLLALGILVKLNQLKVKAEAPILSPVPEGSLTSPSPTPEPDLSVEAVLERAATYYGLDVALFKRIAFCESSYRKDAENGNCVGIFQFKPYTWRETRERMGEDPREVLRYDHISNIWTAAWKMKNDGFGAWEASKACWAK